MTRWFRREAVALVLVAVLGFAAVLLTLRLDWDPYQERQPTDVTQVAAGDNGTLGETAYSVSEVVVVDGASKRGRKLEVAEDARLILVTLDVRPGSDVEPGSCEPVLVAGDTHWETAGFRETSYSPPDRFETFCDSEATAPYALQVYYVVPADVDGPFELEVTVLQLMPRALRLELDAGAPPSS